MANISASQPTLDMSATLTHRAAIRARHAASKRATTGWDGTRGSAQSSTRAASLRANRTNGSTAPQRTAYLSPAVPASRPRVNPLRHLARGIAVSALVLMFAFCAYFGTRGYALYQDAAASMTLDEMAADIESTPAYTPIETLPDTYLDAVVAVEDKRFYQHPGFDVLATGRALVNDIRAGAIVEGGSTITQQLAKNEYFSQEQTIERKIAEIFMAFDIERHFSKDEILELYVNSIYFGDGYYGIGQAAQGYFGKSASSLTDYEATMLAGTPNAPSAYAPTVNPDLAVQRQRQVLDKMVENDLITQDEANSIANPDRR